MTLTAVMFSGAGCSFIPKEEEVLAPPIKEPEKVVFDTVEVKLSSIESSVECTGTYVSVYQQDVYYSTRAGRLKAVNVKEGAAVKKGDILAEVDTDNLEKEIAFQELNLKRAQLTYDKMKSQYTGSSADIDLELARLSVEESTLRLENMKADLESAKLRAPIDGQVTYFNGAKVGDSVNTFQVIFTIADPTNLQIRYAGDQLTEFKLGYQVEITQGTQKYAGEVVATPEEMPADANPQKKQSILINAAEIPDDTKMGVTVTIKLVKEKKDDVIVISKGLINVFSGRTYVNILNKDGIREERDVEVGISTPTEVEIRKGLSVGELVIRK